MWSLGCEDDNGGEFCFSEPFHGGHKLRPLVPRPSPSRRVNGANFSSQYYHLANLLNDKISKKELLKNDNSSSISSPPLIASSSRWNPTAEQLRILEELYRRGTRTPSADQIQHIAAQLRRFGKIEGKNVFYWFQNHKARERQKRRRQTSAEQTKYSEAEKTNCGSSPSKIYTATIPQKCTKTQRKPTVVELEEEGERRRDSVETDETWKNNTVNCQLMNPTRKTRHRNSVVDPCKSDGRHNGIDCCNDNYDNDDDKSKATTLQLFPLRSTKYCKYGNEREGREENRLENVSDSDMIISSTFSPSCFQFFEFLPLKN